MQKLETLIKQLPPELQEEVKDFVEFLLEKKKKPRRKLKMNWAGALKDLKSKYTSVELQHKILDWRIGEK
jgi:galactose-1-phosphate uridylyltransferase